MGPQPSGDRYVRGVLNRLEKNNQVSLYPVDTRKLSARLESWAEVGGLVDEVTMVTEYNRAVVDLAMEAAEATPGAVVDLAMEAAEATPGVGRSQTALPRIGVSR